MKKLRIMSPCYFFLSVPLFWLSLSGCNSDSEAQSMVDQTIEAHGGELFKKAKFSFVFRDKYYEIHKGEHRFEYSREFRDSLGRVKDVLNNEGFQRTIDGENVALDKERETAFSNSVNSVAYFALLPYGLNDEAVIKEYLGEDIMEGKKYHLIKVSFKKNGGGNDFEDEFLYWIDPETHYMEYMAYSYQTDGGGVRLRKATNPRFVRGVRILDYANYKPKREPVPLEDMAVLYREGQLDLLSEIILEEVKVDFTE